MSDLASKEVIPLRPPSAVPPKASVERSAHCVAEQRAEVKLWGEERGVSGLKLEVVSSSYFKCTFSPSHGG